MGRLRNGMRWHYIEVVNTSTGKVVHRDDTGDLSRCCDYARENVATARKAWTMGLRTKDLKASKR